MISDLTIWCILLSSRKGEIIQLASKYTEVTTNISYNCMHWEKLHQVQGIISQIIIILMFSVFFNQNILKSNAELNHFRNLIGKDFLIIFYRGIRIYIYHNLSYYPSSTAPPKSEIDKNGLHRG